ncbi:hypothetical protein PG987_011552 [Apiospora arundinis]
MHLLLGWVLRIKKFISSAQVSGSTNDETQRHLGFERFSWSESRKGAIVTKGDGNKVEEAKRDPEDGGGSNSQKGHKEALRDDDLKQLDLNRVAPPDRQQSEDLPLKGKAMALHLEPGGHSYTTDDAQSMGSESLGDTSCSSNASFVPSVVSAWLASIQEFQDYSAIARACEGICGQKLEDTDNHGPPRGKAPSGNEQDTGKSSNVHGKRKASDVGDIQGRSSSAKPKLSVQSSVLDDDNRPIKRWYFIWRKLFPNTQPPQCPFWQPNEPSASQLYNYMMENLSNGTDPEENVEPIVQRVRTLWADFLNSNAESSSRQLETPETSSGSTFGGSSATNASPASHRASMDRTLAMLAPSPQRPKREPSHVQATPSSLGVGPVSSTHGRQMVETQPDDATLFSESSELQEGSRSSHAATSPGPHPEATSEEQQPYDMRSPTSTLEAGPGTNNHTTTDDVRPTQFMITPEVGPELEGLLSKHVDSDQVNFGNFDFELCIMPEFNADFDDNFDFMTQYTYNAGHFEDLEDDSGVGN